MPDMHLLRSVVRRPDPRITPLGRLKMVDGRDATLFL
jgi:hypothetical protein